MFIVPLPGRDAKAAQRRWYLSLVCRRGQKEQVWEMTIGFGVVLVNVPNAVVKCMTERT